MNVQKLKGIIKVKMQDKRGIKKNLHDSSTTSLLHRYHADDLSLYIKSNFRHIYFTYGSFILVFFRNQRAFKNHNFCSNLPFFTFVTSDHKPVIGRLFASAIKFLFRHFNPSFVKFSFSLGLVRLLNRGL